MQVLTTRGLVELASLTVRDLVEVGDNHRKVIVQYYLGDELVKQSVHVDMLRPVEAAAAEGKMNG